MKLNVAMNSAGVVLATLGSGLAWYYLGQIDFSDRKAFLQGESILTVRDATPEAIRKLRWNIWLSRFGIFLVVVGGTLQLGSNFVEG